MADSDQVYREVLKIKSEVESLQRQTQWLLVGQASHLESQWKPVFGLEKSKKANYTKMRVYLAANGQRSIRDVAKVANAHESDVRKLLLNLESAGLVEPLPQTTGITKVYSKTPADRPLRISKTLEATIAARTRGTVQPDTANNDKRK